jgi:hypothetical protein
MIAAAEWHWPHARAPAAQRRKASRTADRVALPGAPRLRPFRTDGRYCAQLARTCQSGEEFAERGL